MERRGLRAWARNSPWVMIAVLLHVLVVAILSIVVLQAQRSTDERPATSLVRARPAVELPPEIAEAPPDRTTVPLLPTTEGEVAVPEERFVLDAAAGRTGEITEETDPFLDPGRFNPDPEALSELPSGATGGTPIGVGSIGHRGAGTSAFSGRLLGGGGKGSGGVGGNGGDGPTGTTTLPNVLAALDWLRDHQSSDGSWDCDGFTAQCRGEPCLGVGSGAHDVGVTGLALLAFLGAGATHVEGHYRETVLGGVRWLMSVQDEEGCFGARIGQGFLYDHACAALAMAEAYGMTGAKPLREPAQRGIAFVLRAQNPYAGWRYSAPGDGDNDTSVTGWMVMALKSAQLAGLVIDDVALQSALGWIDQMTDPVSGRTGYTDTGGLSSRMGGLEPLFPAESTEAMTAVGVLVRIFGGRTREKDPMIERGAARLAARLPRWDQQSGEIDFYGWYYGTLAMFQVGGRSWERWHEAIEPALVAHQHLDRAACTYGSWDPIDPWSASGGRVYATALNCLTMEVTYRYPRVFGTKR